MSLSAPTVVSTSKKALVKTPCPCSSFACSFAPQAARRTCDLRPHCRKPGAVFMPRLLPTPCQMSRSRVAGTLLGISVTRDKRVGSVWSTRVPEPEWQQSNMTVYYRVSIRKCRDKQPDIQYYHLSSLKAGQAMQRWCDPVYHARRDCLP